ncbi:MAG: hypothetical protein HC815_07525 [Richelia sp. RM1_1_1]|nr:hypothetical protein [Richelia sp. RM1_1_1]
MELLDSSQVNNSCNSDLSLVERAVFCWCDELNLTEQEREELNKFQKDIKKINEKEANSFLRGEIPKEGIQIRKESKEYTVLSTIDMKISF